MPGSDAEGDGERSIVRHNLPAAHDSGPMVSVQPPKFNVPNGPTVTSIAGIRMNLVVQCQEHGRGTGADHSNDQISVDCPISRGRALLEHERAAGHECCAGIGVVQAAEDETSGSRFQQTAAGGARQTSVNFQIFRRQPVGNVKRRRAQREAQAESSAACVSDQCTGD